MRSKSDNIEITMNNEADEVIEQLFESLKKRYHNKLEESMKCSEFVFDYVHLLYYKCHKITKIKLFINRYNWKEINFPLEKNDWKKFEKNNRTIALNVWCAKEKNISCLCFKT